MKDAKQIKHDPHNTIANFLQRARATAETKWEVQNAINSATETALRDSLDFAWHNSHSCSRIDRKNSKVVFSIVNKNLSSDNLRDDGKVQCWATKSNYAAAKNLADSINEGSKIIVCVIAQYVDAKTLIND